MLHDSFEIDMHIHKRKFYENPICLLTKFSFLLESIMVFLVHLNIGANRLTKAEYIKLRYNRQFPKTLSWACCFQRSCLFTKLKAHYFHGCELQQTILNPLATTKAASFRSCQNHA